jgi:hypothetical protein
MRNDSSFAMGAAIVVGSLVLLIAMIGYLGWFYSTHECVRTQTVQQTFCHSFGQDSKGRGGSMVCTTSPAEQCVEWREVK